MTGIASLGPLFAEAFGVLAGNRTRSLLTITGLIIGVAAVIAIETVGSGTAGAVSGILGGLSDRTFVVFPNSKQGDFAKAAFDVRDLDLVAADAPNVVTAVPGGGISRMVTNGHVRARLNVSADSDVPFSALPLLYGRAISRDDVVASAHVCVLSDHAYARLFPGGGDPTGRSVRAGDLRLVVIGVQGKPSGILPVTFGGDVSIPYPLYETDFLRGRSLVFARFLVRDPSQMAQTERAVIDRFRALKANRAEYQTFDRKAFSNGIDGVFAALTLVVAMIGAVSLVVAGIGIMNIMLVSVTERTREIGVRKAIGATRAQILAQFFIEALLLSLVGCGIGLCIGLTLGFVVDRFALVAISGVVPDVPWFSAVAIAVGFATIVTLLFGTYPAYRAARLDPIEALRYE